MAIAGKRLSLLLGCLNKLNPFPTGIQESIDASIVSAFPDAKHVYKGFRMNDCEKDYIINLLYHYQLVFLAKSVNKIVVGKERFYLF